MNSKGFLLFDIDGVIRDVSESYRLAIQKTVTSFSNWSPSIEDIDNLKSEGYWNNDWDVSLELIRRYQNSNNSRSVLPNRKEIINKFNSFYFDGDLNGASQNWKGFIKNEKLLVDKKLFEELDRHEIKWGFVSGAEPPSAKFVLEERLGLKDPPLIAMGDAPEKPNPYGFLNLIRELAQRDINSINTPIAYIGDTVADVLTVKNARNKFPVQKFISYAVAPPHLNKSNKLALRKNYENKLQSSGADFILNNTSDIISYIKDW